MRSIFPTRLATAAIVLSGALALSGCQVLTPGSGDGPQTGAESAPPGVVGEVPADLSGFYTQEVDWELCEETFACATVEVPLDYGNPARDSIDIALIRSDATGDAQGSVLVNPGGPGGSGVNIVRDALTYVTSDRLRVAYDVVGFDPRGVGASSAVDCQTDEEREADRLEYLEPGISDAEALERLTVEAEEFAAQCAERTGELLGFVDTDSAARDLDILRAAVGDEQLNFLGFSYGTSLGAAYAELFPTNTGRLVLDGAVDLSLTNEEITLGQARAFETALGTYVADCQRTSDCPLPAGLDEGVAVIQDLFRSVEDSPMTAADGRLVTINTFFSGFILPLYDNNNWPLLTSAIDEALQGDPSVMLQLADLAAERDPDGSYATNASDAFIAINCLDYPMVSDPAQLAADADRLTEASPTFGPYLAYGGVTCNAWEYAPVLEPAPASAPDAAPMVVIGTTGDPATPYEWSLALADQLETAVHVTWDGEGHTAYGRADSCIGDLVDSYFIDGTVPEDGVRCD
ncbi:alpha/beta hydrolase [Arthrobacter sp. H20]|uniref:alpha/beta hydrolase n=1 Tax=Arthrobacter sp. H20 TaxID=1267981 RepID=UPI0004799501|nr:alpha/beta hydrolase [Arthrobacter sp. H20]